MRHPLDDLRSVRQFLTVARHGSFSKAARELGMAQPPLSQQIQRLEARLECQLFDRTRSGPRRVTLTAAGEALAGAAPLLLEAAGRTTDRVQAIVQGRAGSLRLGFVSSCASSTLGPIGIALQQRAPGVAVSLVEMTTAQQEGALRAGTIDAGLGRDVPVADSEFERVFVQRDSIRAIVPRGHRLADRVSIDARELRTEDFVYFPANRGVAFYERMMRPCLRAGYVPRVVQEVREWGALLALVGAGRGVSLVPESLLGQDHDGIVVLS